MLTFGTLSEQRVDIVNMKRESGWMFDRESGVTRLSGAHGDDIVRSLCFDDEVCSLDCTVRSIAAPRPLMGVLTSEIPRPSSQLERTDFFGHGDQCGDADRVYRVPDIVFYFWPCLLPSKGQRQAAAWFWEVLLSIYIFSCIFEQGLATLKLLPERLTLLSTDC